MWRMWRRVHVDYINQMLPSVKMMPEGLLEELTRLAMTHDPAVVGETALNLFAEAAGGYCQERKPPRYFLAG